VRGIGMKKLDLELIVGLFMIVGKIGKLEPIS
jgi:hypothetical protein